MYYYTNFLYPKLCSRCVCLIESTNAKKNYLRLSEGII